MLRFLRYCTVFALGLICGKFLLNQHESVAPKAESAAGVQEFDIFLGRAPVVGGVTVLIVPRGTDGGLQSAQYYEVMGELGTVQGIQWRQGKATHVSSSIEHYAMPEEYKKQIEDKLKPGGGKL